MLRGYVSYQSHSLPSRSRDASVSIVRLSTSYGNRRGEGPPRFHLKLPSPGNYRSGEIHISTTVCLPVSLCLRRIAGNAQGVIVQDSSVLVGVFVLVVGFLFVVIIFIGSFFTVNTANRAIVERFSKFNRVALPGFQLKIPLFETVHVITTRVQTLAMNMETKTKDNVFVKIPVSVQYQVMLRRVSATPSTNSPIRTRKSSPTFSTCCSATFPA